MTPVLLLAQVGTTPYSQSELKHQADVDEYLRRASQLMGRRRAASGNAYSLRTYSKWTEPRKPRASSRLVCLPPCATQIHPFLCVRRTRKSQKALPRPCSNQLAWNCGSATGTLSAESMQVPCFYNRWCQPASTLWLNTSALIMFSKYSQRKKTKS